MINSENRKRVNYPWINTLKGIGIICVVVGHVCGVSRLYIYWFHMPLFFYISGYLYQPDAYLSYLERKMNSLIKPYFMFLFSFAALQYLIYGKFIGFVNLLLGGKYLGSHWFAIYWFVTVLFFVQQTYNLLFNTIHSPRVFHFVIIAMWLLSEANLIFLRYNFCPWSLNLVPMAFLFFHFGHADRLGDFDHVKHSTIMWLSVLFVLLAIFFEYYGIINTKLAMKHSIGVPLFSTLLALGIIALLKEFVSRYERLPLLAYLGKNTMYIMYIHQPLQLMIPLGSFAKIVGSILGALVVKKGIQIIDRSR